MLLIESFLGILFRAPLKGIGLDIRQAQHIGLVRLGLLCIGLGVDKRQVSS